MTERNYPTVKYESKVLMKVLFDTNRYHLMLLITQAAMYDIMNALSLNGILSSFRMFLAAII